jgi:gas vesicle protein
MDRKTEVLIAFAAGVAAGVLLAPASGKETRKKIADTAEDLFTGAKEGVGDRAESIKAKAGAFKEAMQTARDTFRDEMDKSRS